MRVPRLLLIIPPLVAGIVLPGLGLGLPRLAGHEIGMEQETYDRPAVTIPVGTRLTLVNNSYFLHVLAPGRDARVQDERGMPTLDDAFDTHVSQQGDRYTTAAWNTPGTYYLTCTLHPEMTLKVIVRSQ